MTRLIVPLLLLVSMGSLAQGQQADSKPNLSGTWVFDAQKSALKMPAPTSLTMKIQEQNPQIQIVRTQAYGDQTNTWNLDIVADGQKEVVQKSDLYTSNIRMYWEGNSLVLDEKITATDGTKVSNLVTYSLAPDGTLQAVEKIDGAMKKPITNKWVYDKQAQ